jgi:hypothetical protein
MATRRKWLILLIAGAAVVVGAVLFFTLRLSSPPPSPVVQQRDPLCQFVESKRLRCVAIFGADTLLGPGAIVDYAADSPPDTPVPLPVAALFSTSCLVPGAQGDALKSAAKQPNKVTVPTLTYKFDRAFGMGASIPVPKVAGVELKAGPNISQLRDLALKVPMAWVQMMDENLFLDALENSGIRTACVDRLLEQKYQIVSAALVGQGIDYELTDKNNQTYSASVAAKKGLISFGADAHMQDDAASKLASQDALVMGVTFLKTEALKSRTKDLKKPVVWSATGDAQLSVAGGGGERHLSEQKVAAGLGQPARLKLDGAEQSECDSGYEVTRSHASGEVRVSSTDRQSLEFVSEIEARGGHYATAAGCVAGKIVGITGHDNSTTVNITMAGYIRSTVRSDLPLWLDLQAQDLPEDTVVSVQGPDGTLIAAEGQTAMRLKMTAATPLRFRLSGEGVYIVTAISTSRVVANGAQTTTYKKRGTLKASTAMRQAQAAT